MGRRSFPELLGDYLPMLADAATFGRFPGRAHIEAVRLLGRRAPEQGVSAGSGVDLYLSAARRMWAGAVLQVVDDAVATFVEGYAEAGREMVRRGATLRRELVEACSAATHT